MGCKKCRERLSALQLQRLEREKLIRRKAQQEQAEAPRTEK